MEIAIHIWESNTRPCRFCLCLQGGAVFADFDTTATDHVYLRRISFDGFGCCDTDQTSSKMDRSESEALLESVRNNLSNHEEIQEILYRYFATNKSAIWYDALREHELLTH